MSILKVLLYPDKRLRKTASPVNKINNNIHKIINNMFDTMYAQNGIGLAATQINIHKQIIVIDIPKISKTNLVLINPKLINKKGNISTIEGCLSIPNEHHSIERASIIKIHAFNEYGKKIEITANNLLAVCIQHEMDHLIGKLFIDYIIPNKK